MPKGAYDPERVQLCAQGMIIEEHGSLKPDAGAKAASFSWEMNIALLK